MSSAPAAGWSRENIRRWLRRRTSQATDGAAAAEDDSDSSSSSGSPEHSTGNDGRPPMWEPRTLRFSASPTVSTSTTEGGGSPPIPLQHAPPPPHAQHQSPFHGGFTASSRSLVELQEREATLRELVLATERGDFVHLVELPLVKLMAGHAIGALTTIVTQQADQLRRAEKQRRHHAREIKKVTAMSQQGGGGGGGVRLALLDTLLHEMTHNLVPSLYHVAAAGSTSAMGQLEPTARGEVGLLAEVCGSLVGELRQLRETMTVPTRL